MCSWDIIEDITLFIEKTYPEVDIKMSKKEFKKRSYEHIILDEIINRCCDRPYNDPIDIIEELEIAYEYLNTYYIKNNKNNYIYKVQLDTIKNVLNYLRGREDG